MASLDQKALDRELDNLDDVLLETNVLGGIFLANLTHENVKVEDGDAQTLLLLLVSNVAHREVARATTTSLFLFGLGLDDLRFLRAARRTMVRRPQRLGLSGLAHSSDHVDAHARECSLEVPTLDGLATSSLGHDDRLAHDHIRVGTKDRTDLLVDGKGDTLDARTTEKTTDGRVGDAMDAVTHRRDANLRGLDLDRRGVLQSPLGGFQTLLGAGLGGRLFG